jgi:RNA polymerase sigma factor (TIGR02999 family)
VSDSPRPPEPSFDALYRELRRIAGALFRGEPPSHTLQPTALVHEAWVRLAPYGQQFDHGQFLRIAARTMRRLLVDHARRRRANRRDVALRVSLDPEHPDADHDVVDLLALDEALNRLAEDDARAARVVELRVLAGMTLQEVADAMELSVTHTKRIVDDAMVRLRRLV